MIVAPRRNSMRRVACIIFLAFVSTTTFADRKDQPKWIRVSSSHFAVLTDAGQKQGTTVVLRFEQLRTVFGQLLSRTKLNLSVPVEIFALGDEQQYLAMAPIQNGHPILETGFFLRSEERAFAVLNATDNDSWRQIASGFAHLLMDFNYPPTQAWFDEGIAQYVSSLQFTEKQVLIGGDPTSLLANRSQPSKSFSDLLSSQPWIPIQELFSADAATKNPMFAAESWIVMHYLISKDRLSDAGTYFGLVKVQKIPVSDAIQRAFGMNAAEFEKTLKEYFQSVAPQLRSAQAGGPIQVLTGVPGTLDVGTSMQDLKAGQAEALLAEVSVRLPEHRRAAMQKLQALENDPTKESVVAHRALAWVDVQEGRYGEAKDEIGQAIEMDLKDPWARYYAAYARYKETRANGKTAAGLANTFQDLRVVIDWNPGFADAYNMLAMARLDGGGPRSAKESMTIAIQLAPRSESYLFNMAQIDIAGKNWEEATSLLQKLKDSRDPQLAKAAQRDLDDLPTLRKYGLLPEHPEDAAKKKSPPPVVAEKKDSDDEEIPDDDEAKPKAAPKADTRPIKFAKGKLVAVDCSQPPSATLTVLAGAQRLHLHTLDYKALTLVGADEFSCDWQNRNVAVNYRASGSSQGDLVSIEVQ